jgi:hypothetical protein
MTPKKALNLRLRAFFMPEKIKKPLSRRKAVSIYRE